MPYPAYIRFTDKGKHFPATEMREGRENTSEVLEFMHCIAYVDTDFFSGKVNRKHVPVILQIPLSNATPALYEHVCSGDKIDTIEILWFNYEEKQHKALFNYFTHKFDNAKICSVKTFFHNIKDPEFEKYPPFLIVEFRYEWVTWTYNKGFIQFKDKWEYVYSHEYLPINGMTQEQVEDVLNKATPLCAEAARFLKDWQDQGKKQFVQVNDKVAEQKEKIAGAFYQIVLVDENGLPIMGAATMDETQKESKAKVNIVHLNEGAKKLTVNWNEIAMNFVPNKDIGLA